MVAITTMATVSSCQRANALSFEDFNSIIAALSDHEIFDLSFDTGDSSDDYNEKLQLFLKANGLKAEAVKIQTLATGNEKVLNLTLVMDKNFKGKVNNQLFDSPAAILPSTLAYTHGQSDKIILPLFASDIRKDIARKNLILLI